MQNLERIWLFFIIKVYITISAGSLSLSPLSHYLPHTNHYRGKVNYLVVMSWDQKQIWRRMNWTYVPQKGGQKHNFN